MRGFCLVESSPITVESPTYCCSGQIQMYPWGYPTETVAMCVWPITVLVAYTLLPVSRVYLFGAGPFVFIILRILPCLFYDQHLLPWEYVVREL